MEPNTEHYSCAIIGGGLAGLCLAIQLADTGVSVIVFEKNTYPFHKVCGEYISMESYSFLMELGLDLNALNLPKITQLGISSEKGFMLNAPLDMGGFGISRYSLDHALFLLAKQKGVAVQENCRVMQVDTMDEKTSVLTTSSGRYTAGIICGSFGKYTPVFAKDTEEQRSSLNYIGVKYHIKTDLSPDRIELHNFTGGYCGVSKVDKETYCLCYLADADTLKQAGNNIRQMEETVLWKNPFLKKYFTTSEFLFDQPLTISNVSFSKKHSYQNNIFLLGDAAGSITPLCGNGMSMAMRASYILAGLVRSYIEQVLTKQDLINAYEDAWNSNFNARITSGYYLQYLFGKKHTTHFALKVLDKLPALTQKIIGLTHGNSF